MHEISHDFYHFLHNRPVPTDVSIELIKPISRREIEFSITPDKQAKDRARTIANTIKSLIA